jgi:hypothetical protein
MVEKFESEELRHLPAQDSAQRISPQFGSMNRARKDLPVKEAKAKRARD